MTILILLGLALLIIGVIALIKGEIIPLRITNKKIGAGVLAAGLLLMIIGFAGITTGVDEVAEEPKDPYEEVEIVDIQFNESIVIDDTSVEISGSTNLTDGTLLHYEVYNLYNEDNHITGEIEVTDGNFTENVDISDFTNGEIVVWLEFLPFEQSETIIEKYGEFGDYIAGERIEYSEELNSNIITAEERYTKNVPITLSETGDTATELFFLKEGFAVLDFNHTGTAPLIVELKDETGKTIDTMINKLGEYSGTTAAYIPDNGEYLLNIRADGSWNAEISQKVPPQDEVPDVPHTFIGVGDDVKFIYLEEGLKRYELVHQGTEDFIVKVSQDIIADHRRSYEGSTAHSVDEEGIHLIRVVADGSWAIKIE